MTEQITIQTKADRNTVFLFTSYGMGHASGNLQLALTNKFLSLTLESGILPAKILFYTEGVKLACHDSPVLSQLQEMYSLGVELILCKTCLDFFNLGNQVEVGIIGGMPDIIETIQKAAKVITL